MALVGLSSSGICTLCQFVADATVKINDSALLVCCVVGVFRTEFAPAPMEVESLLERGVRSGVEDGVCAISCGR